jgi:hypothetical protein
MDYADLYVFDGNSWQYHGDTHMQKKDALLEGWKITRRGSCERAVCRFVPSDGDPQHGMMCAPTCRAHGAMRAYLVWED